MAANILGKISSRGQTSEITGQHGTPNIRQRTLRVQSQEEIRSQFGIENWTPATPQRLRRRIGHWTFAARWHGTKSLLPSPSNRFSLSEYGAAGGSNPNFTKSFRRRSASANRGKLSIVAKCRAWWWAAHSTEELCMNYGHNSETKSLGMFRRRQDFRCSSKFSMRRRSCHYRCIHLTMSPADWEANPRASSGTWPPRIGTPSFSLDFARRSRARASSRDFARAP